MLKSGFVDEVEALYRRGDLSLALPLYAVGRLQTGLALFRWRVQPTKKCRNMPLLLHGNLPSARSPGVGQKIMLNGMIHTKRHFL